MRTVERSTVLAAPADRVWAEAVTLPGVNRELRPIVRMTAPPGLRDATIDDLELGVVAGRSWLLLGGLIPVDYDDLRVVERGERRFLERSELLSMSLWQHEREVTAVGEGSCRLTDRLTFELRSPLRRLPGFGALSERIVRFLFRHRHRRLTEMHGAGPSG